LYIEKIEENKNNPKRFFNKTASIKRGYKPQTRILRNELGELTTKEESVVEKLKKHFVCLLNITPPTSLNEEIYICNVVRWNHILKPQQNEKLITT